MYVYIPDTPQQTQQSPMNQQPIFIPNPPVKGDKIYRKLRKQVLKDIEEEAKKKAEIEKLTKKDEKKKETKWPFSTLETAMMLVLAAPIINTLLDLLMKVKSPL